MSTESAMTSGSGVAVAYRKLIDAAHQTGNCDEARELASKLEDYWAYRWRYVDPPRYLRPKMTLVEE